MFTRLVEEGAMQVLELEQEYVREATQVVQEELGRKIQLEPVSKTMLKVCRWDPNWTGP